MQLGSSIKFRWSLGIQPFLCIKNTSQTSALAPHEQDDGVEANLNSRWYSICSRVGLQGPATRKSSLWLRVRLQGRSSRRRSSLLDVHGRHGCFCSVSVSIAGRRGGLLCWVYIDRWLGGFGRDLPFQSTRVPWQWRVRTSQIDWFVRVCFLDASL
jgi:hypothetical protein